MIFIKTFKGYEDRTLELDETVNDWIVSNGAEVVDVKTVISHEQQGRARSGDLLHTVLYKSEKPLE